MTKFWVALSLTFPGANALADVIEMKCNWVLSDTGGIYYESPENCGHDAVIEGKKRGSWTLNVSLAKPAECPGGFTQAGPVQGGVIGNALKSQYAGARYVIEARRICIK